MLYLLLWGEMHRMFTLGAYFISNVSMDHVGLLMSIMTAKHLLIFLPHSPHGMSHSFTPITHCGHLGVF